MISQNFALDLSRLVEKAKGQTQDAVRKVMLDTFTRVVRKSPVGNPDLWVTFNEKTGEYVDYIALNGAPEGYVGGRFKANWQIGYGVINTTVDDKTDKTGAPTTARINATLNASPIVDGVSIFLTNSLPYSSKLEHGWSSQAPVGMVRTALAEIVAKYGS